MQDNNPFQPIWPNTSAVDPPASKPAVLLALLLAAAALPAVAQEQSIRVSDEPRKTFVAEIEREKDRPDGGVGHALTLYPGLRWKDGWINQLEFRLSHEREREREDGLTRRSINRDFAVRVRKNIPVAGSLGGFVRVLAGQKREQDVRYPFGYAELALTYPIGRLELYSGYRFIRALDNTPGKDRDQLRLGLGYEINDEHEVEFRIARAWDSRTRDLRSTAAEVELTWKF